MTRIFGMHAGARDDVQAVPLFETGCVALGFMQTGNLAALADDPGVFRDRVRQAYPEKTPAAIANIAGQLRRFVHVPRIGDLVVVPVRADRTVRVGKIMSGYVHDPTGAPTFPQRHSVEWLATIERDSLSQAARNEIGSAMSFFEIRRHGAEILRAAKLDINLAPATSDPLATDPEDIAVDTGAGLVSADAIEQQTVDFVLDVLRNAYAEHALETLVADLLSTLGYQARVTTKSGDHGVDVIAGRGPFGLDPPIIKCQVKNAVGRVGRPVLQQLVGSLEKAQGERGLVVSTGGFSKDAAEYAANNEWLRLVGPDELVRLLLDHYDALPARHRARMPLRRVHVPEPSTE